MKLFKMILLFQQQQQQQQQHLNQLKLKLKNYYQNVKVKERQIIVIKQNHQKLVKLLMKILIKIELHRHQVI